MRLINFSKNANLLFVYFNFTKMSELKLNAIKREGFKQSDLTALRTKGMIPGIFYGAGEENIPIAANELALRPFIYTSESHIINLSVEGMDKAFSCIMKDVQFDPVKYKPIHFDVIALHADEKLKIEVSVVLQGNAPGVRDGGVIQHSLHKLEIECLPKDIPSHIDVDISGLQIGDSVKVADLKLENVTILNDEHASVVAVVHPTVIKEPEAEGAEGETKEPEVIGKSKESEE